MDYEEFCKKNNLPIRNLSDFAFKLFNFFEMKYIYEKFELNYYV